MTQKELEYLKAKLPPKGGIRKVAEMTARTPQHVRNVFRGMYMDVDVIRAAKKVAEEYQEELKQLSKEIKKL